jgi:hypothetical protein
MSEDCPVRICPICQSFLHLDEGLCRRCGYDLSEQPGELESVHRSRLAEPLSSMRVYKREFGMSAILIGFGLLLLAGGWMEAYLGGMWQFTARSSGAAAASLALFSNYARCAGLDASSQMFYPMFGRLASGASCQLHSLNPSGLTFVALGGLSMLVGLASFRKRFSSVGQKISALWWILALAIPFVGGLVAYVGVRQRNRTSAINMALLAVETLFGSALLYLLTGFPLSAM